jgi:chromosome partitioning protein
MAKTISVTNQKGGVGKTTTSVNLAACLSHAKQRTLLIDLDAQANATKWLLNNYGDDGRVIYDVMLRKVGARECVVSSPCGVDILPSNLALATLDMDLISEFNREQRLSGVVNELSEYDYVVIDCPPNLGLSTINALVAADVILIPIECRAEAWDAVPRLMNTLRKVVREFQRVVSIYALPTFLDRSNLSRDILHEIEEKFETSTLSPIHKNVKLAEAFAAREPIIQYDPTATGALDYLRISKEILANETATSTRQTTRKTL